MNQGVKPAKTHKKSSYFIQSSKINNLFLHIFNKSSKTIYYKGLINSTIFNY